MAFSASLHIQTNQSIPHKHSKVTFSEIHTFHIYTVVNVMWTTILTILSSQICYIPAYNHYELSIMKQNIGIQCIPCAYIVIDSFILRKIILPKLLVHHKIMKMSFLCHFIIGWDVTRTIILMGTYLCICLHVNSTVDTFPEITMLLILLKLKYLLGMEHISKAILSTTA